MKKIKVFLGAYVNSTQAQCLNCRALAKWLDRDKFMVAARTIYSGDLAIDELRPDEGLKLFRVCYPAKIWSWVQFVRGLLWCDIAYLPSPGWWKLARLILGITGKKGFKTIEGALIGTNLEKAIAREGDEGHVVQSLMYTGNAYSITKWMRPVNERIVGIVTKPTVLYLGVDSETFFNDVPRDKLTDVAIIGSNLFYKGIKDFFELARRFPQVKFHVIGSGMGKVSPEEEISRLKLVNCIAEGTLTHAQLSEKLKTIQLHVFPSRAEGFPKVTLETAAAGVPSVVYDDYGADEWITTGKDGFVVKTLDEMASVIQDLLDHPEKLQPLADNARALAARFDWKVRVKDWEREIERIVRGVES